MIFFGIQDTEGTIQEIGSCFLYRVKIWLVSKSEVLSETQVAAKTQGLAGLMICTDSALFLARYSGRYIASTSEGGTA
jgi:hypothetical protein